MIIFSSVTTEYWGGDATDEERLSVFFQTKFYQDTLSVGFDRRLEKQQISDGNVFLNGAFYENLNKEINKEGYVVLTRINEGIFYRGDRELAKIDIGQLPRFNSDKIEKYEYDAGKNSYRLVKKYDFFSLDKDQISVFVMKKLSSLTTPIYLIFLKNLIVLTLAIVIVYSILSFLIARSITRPLDRLLEAIAQLRNGSFDHEIKPTTCDKIGEVTVAFEETRRQLKRLFNQEREFELSRKEMIANLSHDIKTPLTSIKIHFDAINDGVANTEEKKEKYYEIVYKKINDIDNMVNELNLLSNLDINEIDLRKSEVDYNNFLSDVIEEYRFNASMKKILLNLDLVGDCILKVHIDLEKMKRVVVNIIENSIKYGSVDKLEINVKVVNTENWITTIIEDNGVGLKESNHKRIFDRFFREDDSRNQERHGSGLGLAIAKQIVMGHGGMIWADESYREGLKIVFKIPIE